MLQPRVRSTILLRALLVVLVGCTGSDVTAPAPASVEPTGSPRFSASDVGSVNEQAVPIALTFTNACNGEVVALEGKMHVSMNPTTSESGGVLYQAHLSFQGRGVGTFGNEYVGHSDRQEMMNAPTEGTFTTTVEETTVLNAIRPNGSALPDDYRLHTLMHFTFTNGRPTAVKPSTPTIEFTCR